MTQPHILQLGPYPPTDQTALDQNYNMHKLFDAADQARFLAQHGPKIHAIAARGVHHVPSTLIDACPQLELIAVYGVGFDGVDLDACRARGIRVTNTPDVLTEDVADWGIAMMLAARRGLVGAERWLRDGAWANRGPYQLGRRAHGAKAGILGLGRIGKALGRRLAAFDMELGFADPNIVHSDGYTKLPDAIALARWSDVLFVTLAASDATRHIVDASVLTALGPDGLLVNISRASNVDEDALITALQSGRLGYAALDVFAGEPKIDPRLLQLDNVLLTPHHASATVETRADMGALMRANISAHFAGEPLLTPVL